MATSGDTLSLVLLWVAIGAMSLSTCGVLLLAAQALGRRRQKARALREAVTVQFRAPLASDPGPLDLEAAEPASLEDPTDRFSDVSLFEVAEASARGDEDPFDGDTVPFLDVASG